ncbi:MAG: hypothetical protein WCS15_08275, partial [Prevotella sp.]
EGRCVEPAVLCFNLWDWGAIPRSGYYTRQRAVTCGGAWLGERRSIRIRRRQLCQFPRQSWVAR